MRVHEEGFVSSKSPFAETRSPLLWETLAERTDAGTGTRAARFQPRAIRRVQADGRSALVPGLCDSLACELIAFMLT
eukprot:1185614-Prorocentrum_minimum.AAC.6